MESAQLTGVNNRRYWFELAEHEFEVATRYCHPLSAILFDIDDFKLVNDIARARALSLRLSELAKERNVLTGQIERVW